MNFLLCGKHKVWDTAWECSSSAIWMEQRQQASGMENEVTHPPEVNGPEPGIRHQSVLQGMSPVKSGANSASSFQKVDYHQVSPCRRFFWLHGSILSMKWFLIILCWLSSQETHDSSLLLFHVVFQQSPLISAVNKTIRLKKTSL